MAERKALAANEADFAPRSTLWFSRQTPLTPMFHEERAGCSAGYQELSLSAALSIPRIPERLHRTEISKLASNQKWLACDLTTAFNGVVTGVRLVGDGTNV